MALLILFSLLKIVVVLGFLVTTAGLLTWAERRQSAMIQDRLGPNRAVIRLPSLLVRGAIGVAGVALGVLCIGNAYLVVRPGIVRIDFGFGLTELAILLTWIGVLALRRTALRSGSTTGLGGALARVADARHVFYIGLAVHALALAGWVSMPRHFPEAVVLGRVPFPPASSPIEAILRAVFVAGPAWLGLVIAVGSIWTALRIASGVFELRLAGILHLLADGAKMAFKEDFVPPAADKLLHSLGPIIALFPALVTFAVVPFGDVLCVRAGPEAADQGLWAQLTSLQVPGFVPRSGTCAEGGIPLQIANLNVGILYMFALAGMGIVGAAIAGYSSNNKFSLLGSLRASSQMVSYEVAMGMTLVGAFMIYGTVRLDDMVRWQSDHAWGIFVQPVAFVLFLAAAVAEQKRLPFDAPEGESEIVAGYFVEYSGMKWAMFYLGEYMEIVVSSALLATIFLGGWAIPFLHRDGVAIELGGLTVFRFALEHWAVVLVGALAFFGKVLLLCWAQLFIRWTLPRFRYDQIMSVGWRILLPGAIINLLVTGVVVLAIDQAGTTFSSTLGVLGDVTQAIVAVAALVGLIAAISGFLKPKPARAVVVSSAARYAQARGGTRASAMQA